MIRWPAWRHSPLTKTFTLLILLLLLCIPLGQIESLIREREATQQSAVTELAQTHVGPQILVGPLLVVPYVERWQVAERNERDEQIGLQPRQEQRWQLFFPQQMDLSGQLMPQERYRGIFTVPFYRLKGQVDGRFAPFAPAQLTQHIKGSTLEVQTPVLALAVSDLRGLDGTPQLNVAGTALGFERRVPYLPGSSWLAGGVHAPLSGAALQAFQAGQPMPFQLALQLTGQNELSVMPLGDDTRAHLTSPWPHPRFGGRFLATERTVTDTGFDARWRIAALTSQAREQVRATLTAAESETSDLARIETFDIALAQPVNVYSMADRAARYGALFIGLVLLAVFTLELLKRLRLHPMQYGLVGLSIAVFFLLLLALSEKMAFAWAYAAAAGASVALLTAYFTAVLRGARRGGALGAYVATLYGALYGLLASESNALLLGALMVFALLATLMLATRRVDWFALGHG